jgi:hypothetical protein
MERSRGRWRIGAELVPVLLVIACVGGTLALVISMHRRAPLRSAPKTPISVLVPPAKSPPAPKPVQHHVALPQSSPPEDLTPKVVAGLSRQTEDEKSLAHRADLTAANIEQAVERAKRERARWRLREALVRKQVDGLEQEAKRAAAEADDLDRLRDALETRIAAAKDELAKAGFEKAVALLPYRGTSGTWKRPICIECAAGGVQLQPNGPSFSLADLMAYERLGVSNPLVRAVARTLLSIDRHASPDGGPIIPYLMFLVRPDGIRAFYEARARLEIIGIAFGYELVDQDAEFSYPDLNDPAEWRDALDSTNLAARGGGAGGERDLRPWPSSTSVRRDAAPFNERDPRPDRTSPRSTIPRGGYAGGAPIPNSLDTRQLQNLSAGRINDADVIPNDGRVELFPGSEAPVPVLLPTPSSEIDHPHPGAPGVDERPRPIGRFQPLGPPARSLPATGRGEVGAIDDDPRLGSGSNSTEDPGASGAKRSTPQEKSLGSGVATGSVERQTIARRGPSGGRAVGRRSGSTQNETTVQRSVDRSGDGDGDAVGSGAGGDVGPSTAAPRPPSGAAPSTVLPFSDERTASGDQGGSIGGKAGADGPMTELPPLIVPLPPAGRSAADASADQSTSVAIPRSTDTDEGLARSDATFANTGSARTGGGGRYGAPPSFSGATPLDATIPSGIPGDLLNGDSIPSAGESIAGDSDRTTTRSTPGSADSPGSATNRTDSATASNTTRTSRSASQASTTNGGTSGSSGLNAGSAAPVEPRIWIEPLKSVGEITIACGPKGVTIHPGGYRFKTQTLAAADAPLSRTLRTVDRAQRSAHPKEDIRPAILFLIEPGGQPAYRLARRQLFLSGLDWPSRFRVAEGSPPRFYSKGEW